MDKAEILDSIHNIPPLSSTVVALLELFEHENYAYEALEAVINNDPGLVVKILQIANSPLYGLQAEITTVREACIVLGVPTIRDIVLCAELCQKFPQKMENIDIGHLWLHALGTAVASKLIAAKLHIRSVNVFIAGLLHEVGHLYVAYYKKEIYQQLLDFRLQNHTGIQVASEEVFGFPIAHISAELIEYWHLPKSISKAIKHHQDMENHDDDVQILHLANFLTNMLEIGDSLETPLYPLNPGCLKQLSLSRQQFKELLPEIEKISYTSKTILEA